MEHQAFAQMLGNYEEFIGAIGVVVTLGYLAIQIRQNTGATRAASQFPQNPTLNRACYWKYSQLLFILSPLWSPK